jgi:hypothetical protein
MSSDKKQTNFYVVTRNQYEVSHHLLVYFASLLEGKHAHMYFVIANGHLSVSLPSEAR